MGNTKLRDVLSTYRVAYRHPANGYAGLSILTSDDDIAAEKVRLEGRGYIVTEVLRPPGASRKPPPTRA